MYRTNIFIAIRVNQAKSGNVVNFGSFVINIESLLTTFLLVTLNLNTFENIKYRATSFKKKFNLS